MKTRSYQQQAEDSAFREWMELVATLIVLPTGAGKTVVAAKIIQRMGGRAMMVAHREELIWQARDKIERITGLGVEVEMGAYRASAETGLFKKDSVIVSSIQTLTMGGDGGGRMSKFNPEDFNLVIIDEAHRAVSPSYRRFIDYLRTNPKLKILGLTATPDRADEEALGQVFDSVAYDYEILDAIHDGWLVPIDQQMVNLGSLDYSSIRTTAGDLNGADLDAVMMAEKNLQGVASSAIEIIGNRRALVFTASVNHASNLAEIFNRHKTGMATWISGDTDKDDRRRIRSDFSQGKIQVVCNCNVWTEGFDDAGVEVVIMASPTKSRARYAQMIGRSTRPLEGLVDQFETPMGRRFAISQSAKPACLIVDYVGVSGRHKLMTTADILGGNVSDEAIESAIQFAQRNGKPIRMNAALDEEQEKIETEREKRRLEEEARKAKVTAKVAYTKQAIDPFDLLDVKPAMKIRKWDEGKLFTEKQAAFLRRSGINPDTISYTQGKQLMAAMGKRRDDGLCTIGQIKKLKQYNIDASKFTYEHAHKTLDAIAANGWRKPAELPSAEPAMATTEGSDNDPF